MEEQMRLYIRLAMEDSGFHLHTSMDNNIYNLINVTRFPSFDTSARMRFGAIGKILGSPNQRNNWLKRVSNTHGSYQHPVDQKEEVEKKIISSHIQKFYPKEPNVQAQVHARKKPRKAGNFYDANKSLMITTFVSHRGREETYYTGGYDPVVPPVAPPPDWLGATDALIRLSVLLRQSFVLTSRLCSPQVPRKRKRRNRILDNIPNIHYPFSDNVEGKYN
ncbi:hypothetical protein M5K25_018269 [Dendrobium thyrsiflorum]|uniref:Uncharacterized protein n=1 Tax=Dendrobium thyrsiflorum TaxID=117978 RepID=A0ABD0UIK1_DENTH